ncbi:MAG: hypothetical protein J5850_05015 [Clostridia bacterium]|nr:hypothetical protein [Clostridia bacterium]
MTIGELWSGIFGNDDIKANFINEINERRLSHAFIFEGPEGSGRCMLARTICAAMTGDDYLAQRIMSGICSDVKIIDVPSGRKTIGVETVREIKDTAFIKPNDVDFKAYIIRNSELLTVQAQNALLKILEEPPADTFFFLLCENVSSLLLTVRSRAPTVRLQQFSSNDLAEYLLRNVNGAKALKMNSPEEFEYVLSISEGTIGRAKALLTAGTDDKNSEIILRERVMDFLETIIRADSVSIRKKCLELPTDREEFSQFIKLARIGLRDIVSLKIDGRSEDLLGSRKRLIELARQSRTAVLLSVYDCLNDTYLNTALNLNIANLKAILATDIVKATKS